MKIPQKIDIGPFTYEVKMVDKKDKRLRAGLPKDNIVYGRIDCQKLVIYLAKGQSKDVLRDTLLHEILHGIFAVVGGWASGIEEEKAVSMFATMSLDTFGKRNKDLAKALFE